MEATYSFEMSVDFKWTTQRYIPELLRNENNSLGKGKVFPSTGLGGPFVKSELQ
jgi:hypothetical protein